MEAGWLLPHQQSDGLTCICSSCEKRFELTSDKLEAGKSTYIHICSCESGGVYDAYVICPHCRHRHNLM